MSFTNFIKRPVLSTVVSIFFVLLGIIGLVSLPIEQYPNIAPPTITVTATYTGCRCPDGVELCRCSAGGEYQRCGEHDLYDLFCV